MFASSPRSLHVATPTLSVNEPRGLLVRSVAYHRAHSDEPAEPRITRQTFRANAHPAANWDPRLWLNQRGPNLTTGYSLSGLLLQSESVDAGWKVRLMGASGELLSEWDSRYSRRQIEHDSLLRPVVITEQADGESHSVTERICYADNRSEFAVHNQCGAMVRHDDTAGSRQVNEYSLAGEVLSESRRFLNDLLIPNWPHALIEREKLLETEIATTCWQFNAANERVSQRDARSNETLTAYNVAGQLKRIELKREGLPDKLLLSQVIYSASGQTEREVTGNEVQTLRRYEAQSDRLLQLSSRFGAHCYQDYHYDYDAVGNITRIEDTAQPVLHFKNRRTAPINTFRYDTLNQLIEATGRESIPTNQGPGLPELHTPQLDPSRMAPYKQTFTYDQAGNLQTLVHEGNKGYTREMVTAPLSNRSLLKTETGDPDFNSCFDANGNLQALSLRTQALRWDTRNQLSEVVQIVREDAVNDDEHYRYNAQSQRVRKVRTSRTKSAVNTCEVRYLPGLEIHRERAVEERHVINIETGSCVVRVLYWTGSAPKAIRNNQIRYNLSNHLGSCTLELDDDADLISQEGYFAFGGTAWWAARSETEAEYKTIRYSAKERDATGLYYYGFRYYAHWLMRWINPDPGGDIDGINLYLFTRNNPICRYDMDGRDSEIKISGYQYWSAKIAPLKIASSKLAPLLTSLLPKNFTLQPSTQRKDGKYKPASGFKAKRIEASEALDILNSFRKQYEKLNNYLSDKIESSHLDNKPYNENQLSNLNLGVQIAMAATNHIKYGEPDDNKWGLFKLVDKKNMTHAFAFTLRNDSSATLEVATVIAHPYSQLPELTNEKRQELSEKYENFNYYNTKKTGTATTLLSIIKEIKSSPSRIKTITTNARNPRSANIVGKFNLPNNSVNATALPFLY
jgi:insecticidal toxin complex protein TccC